MKAGIGLAGAACLLAALAGSPAAMQRTVTGPLERVTANAAGDAALVVAGRRIIVPTAVEFAFPGRRLTVREVMLQAPAACQATGESGLVRSDRCVAARVAGGPPWRVSVDLTDAPDGTWRAVLVSLIGPRHVATGAVTFVSPTDGYIRVGGQYGGDVAGTLVRINDPVGAFSVQQGRACGGEGNCSPDVRFGVDAAAPGVRFSTGAAGCIPVPRLLVGFCVDLPVGALSGMAPIRRGDHVTVEGNEERHGTDTILMAHALVAGRPGAR
jgi:hypothetical protein